MSGWLPYDAANQSDLSSSYMKSKFLIVLSIVATGAILNLANAGEKTPAKALLARAKISRADAEKIVLAAVPSATVKEAELEEDDGGLRWSFDLKTPGTKKTTEVGVDAVTGKIVENKVESEKDEVREKEDKDDAKPGHEHKAH